MRDIDNPPDEGIPDVLPNDPEEQKLYLSRFRGLYPKETAVLDTDQLITKVRETLKLCPNLRIRDPQDVLRFLALRILMPQVQDSPFLEAVTRRIIEAIDDWSATKRLDFVYKHVVGRPVPILEPDFGIWSEKKIKGIKGVGDKQV